jgi:hypothetical protein
MSGLQDVGVINFLHCGVNYGDFVFGVSTPCFTVGLLETKTKFLLLLLIPCSNTQYIVPPQLYSKHFTFQAEYNLGCRLTNS